jgi:hypothetical protein
VLHTYQQADRQDEAARMMDPDSFISLMNSFPYGSRWINANDGFKGTVVGWYVTREGKHGVDLQLDNAKVIHVYQIKWLDPI